MDQSRVAVLPENDPKQPERALQCSNTCRKVRLAALFFFTCAGTILLAVAVPDLIQALSGTSVNVEEEIVFDRSTFTVTGHVNGTLVTRDAELKQAGAKIIIGSFLGLLGLGAAVEMACNAIFD
jgi:hypothetical protein